jgi:hypothetical protein
MANEEFVPGSGARVPLASAAVKWMAIARVPPDFRYPYHAAAVGGLPTALRSAYGAQPGSLAPHAGGGAAEEQWTLEAASVRSTTSARFQTPDAHCSGWKGSLLRSLRWAVGWRTAHPFSQRAWAEPLRLQAPTSPRRTPCAQPPGLSPVPLATALGRSSGAKEPNKVMDVAIPVSAKRCAAVLGTITLLLVAASIGASVLSFATIHDPFLSQVRESLVRLAWVDGEANIPTWYSTSLLLVCAFLLATIATAHRADPNGQPVRWLILSLIFGFLSLDETAQLHELSIAPLHEWLGTSGYLYYAWVIPAAICVALFLVLYLSFLANLPERTRRLFLLAGAIFVGGALGIEAISAKQASLHGEHNLTYHLIITLEELLEMAGVIAFIYALLDYLGRQFTRVGFNLSR